MRSSVIRLWASLRDRIGPARKASVAAADEPVGERAFVAREFDAAFYLAAYPDIAAAGVDPLDHFLTTGWREGRDPNAWFSMRDYVEAYPDVAAAGMNPFIHYVQAGRAEGRTPRFDVGFQYEIIRSDARADTRLPANLRALGKVRTDPRVALAEGLSRARFGLRRLHLTFGHDDYTATYGGSQLCLRLESAACAERRTDHLHLHPAASCLVMRESAEPGPLRVLLNGEPLGVFAAASIAKALKGAGGEGASLAIHGVLGHSPGEIVALARAIGLSGGLYWLHDFASVCAGFQLLRNDVEDCGAPPPESAACRICAYGPFRERHLVGHRRLFEDLALTVVSPSEDALSFWRSATDLPAAATAVAPHLRLEKSGAARAPILPRRLRIAFLGAPVASKGWETFAGLARRFADDARYDFLHLGAYADPRRTAAFHQVIASEAKPGAMLDAVEGLGVDVALIWPLARETFSFVAHEAVAGGAAIVTHPGSGNVAAFVREQAPGLVLTDERDLDDVLASGGVAMLGRRVRRPARFIPRYSAMSFGVDV